MNPKSADVVATVAVHGDSMLPTVRSGRRVWTRFGDPSPRSGDLLVFRQADYLVVHRCLGTGRSPDGDRHWRTRGDGRTDCDGPVLHTSVVGIVVALERDDGWRSVQGRLARCYALAVALHGRFWAEAGALASRADARLGSRFFRPGIEAADRLFLRLADTMFFRVAHPRTTVPERGSAAS